MKKFQLHLDTDSINLENEIHSNNFPLKVKNLAEHCVNFVLGTQNEDDCNDKKYNRETHDRDIVSTINEKNDEDDIHAQKIIAQIFQFSEHNYTSTTRKILL